MAGMVGLQTSHRYGNATMLQATSCSASATAGPTATPARSRPTPRAGPSCMSTSSRRRSAVSSTPISASSPTPRRRSTSSSRSRRSGKAGKLRERRPGRPRARTASAHAAQDPFRRCADQAAARLRGHERGVRPRHLLRQRHRPVADRRRAVPASSTSRATGSTAARPARSAGRCQPRSACAPPIRRRKIVALSGDYDFQFMIEELAVGAQYKLPYLHVVVNNSYLGLIRQAQRGFDMDYQVSCRFENINAPELGVYGVDHVAVAEGLGCKAMRVTDPNHAQAAFATAREWMAEYKVPVVIEFILERVTNIAMGTEIDKINEFEEFLDLPLDDAPANRPRRLGQAAAGLTGRIDRAEICRQPHHAVHELPFLDRFAAAKAAGFKGVEYLFPYDFDRPSARAALEHGLTRCCTTCPPATGRRRARHRHPADRVDDFRLGVAAPSTTPGRLIAAAQLPGRHRAGRCRRARAQRALVGNLRFAATEFKQRAGLTLLIEPINTFDIPGFYLNRTAQALDILDEVGARATRSCSTTSTTRSSMEGELASDGGRSTWPASVTSSWPTTRVAMSPGRARSTTSSCSRHLDRHRLRRLDRLRIQAAHDHHRGRAGLASSGWRSSPALAVHDTPSPQPSSAGGRGSHPSPAGRASHSSLSRLRERVGVRLCTVPQPPSRRGNLQPGIDIPQARLHRPRHHGAHRWPVI